MCGMAHLYAHLWILLCIGFVSGPSLPDWTLVVCMVQSCARSKSACFGAPNSYCSRPTDLGQVPPTHKSRRLEPNGGPGPVERLEQQRVEMRVKRSRSQPPFLFSYTSPDADFDVSNHFENNYVVESAITKVGDAWLCVCVAFKRVVGSKV